MISQSGMRDLRRMYIRRIARKRKDGSEVGYLQLARKVRHPDTGRPRDEVLHHLGRQDQLDQGQLRRLVRSLSRFLEPAEQALMQLELEPEARRGDVQVTSSLAYGGSYLLDRLWGRLEIDTALAKLLKERSFEVDVERHLFALVANRALDPRSKLGVEDWVGRRAAVDGLPGVAVHNLYRAMDFLVEHGDEVQKAVFFSTASLLNLEVDLLFFDTPSTYFEVEEPDEGDDGLRRHGHSKDHRPDRPQVVIGMAVTRDGLPVRCWVLPGNTADASVVEQVQRDLAGWRLNRVVWVMDGGMAGESQRTALQRGGGHLIMGEKMRTVDGAHPALGRAGRYKTVRDNLQVKEVTIADGSDVRRHIVVRNPAEAKRDREAREKLIGRLQEAIEHLNRRKAGTKRHSKAVCELRSHRSMGRYLKELKNGKLRVDLAKVRTEAKLDGKYLLTTTDPSLSAEDVALGYKQLLEVERGWRTLKSTLSLRPVHHRVPDRIRAHVLLCWLALLLVRLAERDSGRSWPRLRDEMDRLHQVEVVTKDGRSVVCSNLTNGQRTILKSLKIEAPKRVLEVSTKGTRA